MSEQKTYHHLEPRPKSLYRQLFVKGTRIRAEVLYSLTVPSADDGEVYTAEEIAESYGLPVEAVHEAIAYCQANPPERAVDHAREDRLAEPSGQDHPDYRFNPSTYYRSLTPQEWARLTDGGTI